MRAELPGERLHRRLGANTDPVSDTSNSGDSGDDGELGDDPKSVVPRWLPEASPGGGWLAGVRADPGRAGAIGLAVVAAVAVLVTVFTLIRDDASPVVSAKLPPVQMASDVVSSASARPTGSATPSPAPEQPVIVSVVGLVKTPGLLTLAPGARVADALTAAGGTLGGADTIGLNMARHLADGEQVTVGIASAPGQPPTLGSSISMSTTNQEKSSTATTSVVSDVPLNLNSATVEELDALPGIGPVTAEAIVSWRDQHGSFSSVDQLGDVDGIGPARLDKLRDLVRV